MDDGPVCVVTRYGRSGTKLFTYRKIPPVQTGSAENAEKTASARTAPIIESVMPGWGTIGSLLAITGQNFGDVRNGGEVLFPWSASVNSTELSDIPDSGYISGDELGSGYELWSDHEIRVRVPDGAQSGSFFVRTASGKSNGHYFEFSAPAGRKNYSDRRSYSLGYTITLKKIRSSGAGSLILWAPRPVNSANQRLVRLVDEEPPAADPDFRGDAVYRFGNLDQNSQVTIKQVFLVQSWAVAADIDPELVKKNSGQSALMRTYLEADPFVPCGQETVKKAAAQIVQGEQNPYKAARLIYGYLVSSIRWVPSSGAVEAALNGKTAQPTKDGQNTEGTIGSESTAGQGTDLAPAGPSAGAAAGSSQMAGSAPAASTPGSQQGQTDKAGTGASAPSEGSPAGQTQPALQPAGAKTALGALESGRADTDAYAFLATALLRAAGVPAVTVSGFRIGANQRAVRHAWVEFYISGIGWLPMDPILGSGAQPGGLPPAFEDVSRYFCGMDSCRVAFSRGYLNLRAVNAGSRHSSPAEPLGCQPFYEEASSAVEAYSSYWGGIEILGLY